MKRRRQFFSLFIVHLANHFRLKVLVKKCSLREEGALFSIQETLDYDALAAAALRAFVRALLTESLYDL